MKSIIGLVLAHHGTNYGALLQSYATQQVVESLGFDTVIISNSPTGKRHIAFDWALPIFFMNQYLNKSHQYVVPSIEPYASNHFTRKKVSDDFRREKLHNIRLCDGYDSLVNMARECKAVIVGSDQMWLPGVSFGNTQSLRFVPDDVRKISYATSLGVSKYPRYCYCSARKMWERIDYLSVREVQGKNIINEICPSADVQVVCDPTYLLTKDEWLKRIPFDCKYTEKYILCYFLGNADWQKEKAREYALKKGLKLVTLLSNESDSSVDLTFADNVVTGASPEDFINWIRGAECIFTDSFHGLAFSVINQKQFYIFYRKRDDSKQSRNSRIDNILKMWDVNDRLVVDDTKLWENETFVNYDIVTVNVEEKRAESLEFLKQALTF